MATWKRQAERTKERQMSLVSYAVKPTQVPAPGFCWVRIKGGRRDGEWIQVLRREYESK